LRQDGALRRHRAKMAHRHLKKILQIPEREANVQGLLDSLELPKRGKS
jgi:hypothetical protein